MEFSIKDFFSKYDQILMGNFSLSNFLFCAVAVSEWFQVVSGGFKSFQVVSGGFSLFFVLVSTEQNLSAKCEHGL